MKLLLTSGGVTNPSIHAALAKLLPKPLAECAALVIPTAIYAKRDGLFHAQRLISGSAANPMCELGWASLGVLELTALPSIDPELWVPALEAADVLLVGGGDALYLAHWLRQSGVLDRLAGLTDTLWVGLSAGSMVICPQIGEEFREWNPPDGEDCTLGLVDFAIFPHLGPEGQTNNTLANAEIWAAKLPCPGYVIDDQTAIVVADGAIEVISEGDWVRLH